MWLDDWVFCLLSVAVVVVMVQQYHLKYRGQSAREAHGKHGMMLVYSRTRMSLACLLRHNDYESS